MSEPEPRPQDGIAQQLRALGDALGTVSCLVGRIVAVVPKDAATSRPVLRVAEVAERLGITDRAVRDQMDRGELPWAWQGRQRVVPLHVWLDQLAAQAKANEPPCAR